MVVLACCFIATAVPFFINKYGFHLPLPTDTTARGTCRISPGFHVDCLPDFSSTAVVSLAAQQECERRFCCWDNSTGFYERQHFNTKIISTLSELQNIHRRRPNSFLMRVFFDTKSEEIFEIFKDGPKVSTSNLISILNRISPNNSEKWRNIN